MACVGVLLVALAVSASASDPLEKPLWAYANTWEPTLFSCADQLVALTTLLQPNDATQPFAPAIAMRRSEDWGLTWSHSRLINDNPTISQGQADPVAACGTDANGQPLAHVAWMDDFSIATARSADLASWQTQLVVRTNNQSDANIESERRHRPRRMRATSNTTLSSADKPWIAALGARVAITFNDGVPYVIESRDAGQTFSQPLCLEPNMTDYYSWFAGGGGALSNGVLVFAYLPIPGDAVDPNRLYGFVRLYFSDGNDPRDPWRRVDVANITVAPQQPCPQWAKCDGRDWFLAPSVALAVNGDAVAVAYTAPGPSSLKLQAYVTVSRSMGMSWQKTVQVSSAPATADLVFPAMAWGAHTLVVGWMDNSDPSGFWNTFVAISKDDGASFGAPIRLSNMVSSSFAYKNAHGGFMFPFGDYWGIVAQPVGNSSSVAIAATWSEGDAWYGNGNTFFATWTESPPA